MPAIGPRRHTGEPLEQTAEESGDFVLYVRSSLVRLVNAGGLGIIVAYIAVVISFVLLGKREPGMPRPFKVPFGNAVGYASIVLVGSAVGLFYWACMRYGAEAPERIMAAEIRSLDQAATTQ